MTTILKNRAGFTLVEILVSLVMVGLVMVTVYTFYIANVRSTHVEDDKVEMQQAQRAAIDFITRELRNAGSDQTDSDLPKIVDARSDFIYFTVDRNADGDIDDVNEHLAFCLYDDPVDGRSLGYVSGNAIAVGAVGSAVASGPVTAAHANHGHEVFAQIEELEFFYTLVDGTSTLSPTVTQMDDIRSVQMTILARVAKDDPKFNDSAPYKTPGNQDWGPYNDRTRRLMQTAVIRFRNMGL